MLPSATSPVYIDHLALLAKSRDPSGMKHLDRPPVQPKLRFCVEVLTARNGPRPYVVAAANEQNAIYIACGRAVEDDQACHVLDILGVRPLSAT